MSMAGPIPFPFQFDALAAPGVVRAMAPADRGIYLALCEEAWGRGCELPADVAYLAALTRCTPQAVERVEQASCETLRRDGSVLRFPALQALREELTARAARVSELQRSRRLGRNGEGAKSLRLVEAATQPWTGPPDRVARPAGSTAGQPPVHRRSTGGQPAVASCALRSSSSGAQRSNSERINPGAQSARAEYCKAGGAPGAKAEEAIGQGGPEYLYAVRTRVEAAILGRAIETRGLPLPELRAETDRRRDVYVALSSARFPAADPAQRHIPERTCRVMMMAPWITDKLARGHAWDARRLSDEAAAKASEFNPIGYVISMCGAAARNIGVPEPTSVFFEAAWRRHCAERARVQAAADARAAAWSGGAGSGSGERAGG